MAMRAVVPAGYMPAPLAEGGPFVLCPGGLSGANYFLAPGDGEHAHHGHGQGADGDDGAVGWEFCPTGFVSGLTALAAEPSFAVPFLRQYIPAPGHVAAAYPAAVRSYHARGPPFTQSRDA